MRVFYTEKMEDDLAFFAKNEKRLIQKVIDLVKNIRQTPYEGLGKPEPLSHQLSGYWSRRVNDEHRLIYSVNEDKGEIEILSCRGHYDD